MVYKSTVQVEEVQVAMSRTSLQQNQIMMNEYTEPEGYSSTFHQATATRVLSRH